MGGTVGDLMIEVGTPLYVYIEDGSIYYIGVVIAMTSVKYKVRYCRTNPESVDHLYVSYKSLQDLLLTWSELK